MSESGTLLSKTGIRRSHDSSYVKATNVYTDHSQIDSSDNLILDHHWTRNSVRTPGYGNKQNRKIGLDLPMNPFTFTSETHNGSVGFFGQRKDYPNGDWSDSNLSGYFGSFSPGPPFSATEFALLGSQALNNLLTGLKDQSINLGVAVAEGRQTINLFVNTANSLANGIRAVKRGDMAGAARALGVKKPRKRANGVASVYQRWLELQYGWKPLLSDLYGACNFLANKANRVPRTKISIASSKTVNFSNTIENDDYRISQSQSGTYTVKYVIYFGQTDQHDRASLGLTNPLAIAWELVPYSFVVDWMLPIGTYLNNLDAADGLSFVKGCKTEFWKGTASGRKTGKTWSYAGVTYTNYGSVFDSTEGVSCVRTRLTGFPSANPPTFKNPFGQFKGFTHPGDHVLNALALLGQAFSK
jgi:hypothetical protein